MHVENASKLIHSEADNLHPNKNINEKKFHRFFTKYAIY